MAEEGNEESWLYGSGEPREDEESPSGDKESPSESGDRPDAAEVTADKEGETEGDAGPEKNGKADQMDTGEPEEVVPNPGDEMEEADREDGERMSGEENSESEESDDDINVVIGDIKSGPNYNIKQRGNLIAGANAGPAGASAATDKTGKQAPGGKFSMEEFESVGTINGTPSHEFSIDSLDEKPWRKPGADITDYFNYGFNEETWRMYCERQKRMRQNESGVGLQGLMAAPIMVSHNQDRSAGPGGRTLTPIANDNSKYGALTALPANRRAGPPPGRRMTGAIDVIGGNGIPIGSLGGGNNIKQENVIQVMTAERREYSRPGMPSGGKFDMPPPVFPPGPVGPPPGGPPGGRNNMGPGGPGGPIIDAFEDEYSYGYEPTQDSQWGANHGNQGWAPSGIKQLTPMVPQMVPAPGMGGGMPPGMQGVPAPQQQRYPPSSSSSSERPSDRDRSMRAERTDREREPRERERDRTDRTERPDRSDGKERVSSDSRRSERESSRRRDRSRSRERSRRRSRSKEKVPATTSSSSSSSRHRERSTRDKKEKKRDGKEESE